jgi:superfamily II DNA or RNA helicase
VAIELSKIAKGQRLAGVVADGLVTVVAVDAHDGGSATLTYRTSSNQLSERIVTDEDLASITEISARRWPFDADGASFRLASEARRMKYAHLSDPFAAVDTSNIEPYPHQIEAVYDKMLTKQPLRYLLADDPGAGKTIMSGLLIRELILRGDVSRCLIVAPGSLVEQWQDELGDKFNIDFELMSRAKVEESRSGNPFLEKDFLIARVDQLSRAEDLMEKLKLAEWDLVIVDEAHKMSAHQYGSELRKTKRFMLGETLRDRTRHLLLLSATPHNGKNEDFLAFMTLLDAEVFAGKLRSGDELPDTSDVMRRLVKENLLTFEGKRIFPERIAESLNFELSPAENDLYERVSDYVKNGMNQALRLEENGDRRRALIVGFALAGLQRRLASSPAAIHQSLARRHAKLTKQAEELRAGPDKRFTIGDTAKGWSENDLKDLDEDDFADDELEEFEDALIDESTAAATLVELEAELLVLADLVRHAEKVRAAGNDTKWIQLRGLLRSGEFTSAEGARKLIVFSEYKDTLNYVADRIANELGDRHAVEVIHGGLNREARRNAQDRFRVDPTARVLVATDAAGEGVNLQCANLMVNYDLPWNPNRIEQRFGRIHRIGQQRRCHLWNLIAYKTREGEVFTRLFEKIDEQRKVYGDQVYDILGDSLINTALKDLLMASILGESTGDHQAYMREVIDEQIGGQMTDLLEERALLGLGQASRNDKIRDLMEAAKTRRLQPWFVEAFFTAALEGYGGRIAKREAGRYEITRVPAALRGPTARSVQSRYNRVTFDKRLVTIEGQDRAEMISPGMPLLNAVVDKVLADHSYALADGAILVDEQDNGTVPRLLLYLDHTVTDGRIVHGQRQVVSRRFQYVEIDQHGTIADPGGEPYLGYRPLTADEYGIVNAKVSMEWASIAAETSARDWAIGTLAGPHFNEVRAIVHDRVERVREKVQERLQSEIDFWDQKANEAKQKELDGKTSQLTSGNHRAKAEEFHARMSRRMKELDLEADLHNSPPIIVAAAFVVPVGLLASHATNAIDPAVRMETDRRAVAAVVAAEIALGRVPEVMAHNNPGYDICSVDPATEIRYFIEVKGHLPQTTEIKVSAQQVQKAKTTPGQWRLAVASVPTDPQAEPTVRYLIEPFRDVMLHFAQTCVPLDVSSLLIHSVNPC